MFYAHSELEQIYTKTIKCRENNQGKHVCKLAGAYQNIDGSKLEIGEVSKPGSYTLQLEAGDGELTAVDTIQIVLYADSCEHAKNQEGFELIPGDINEDCIVDELDLAILEERWLQWNYSTE